MKKCSWMSISLPPEERSEATMIDICNIRLGLFDEIQKKRLKNR